MVRQELKKIVVYTFFLAILFIPMLGFKTPTFQPDRVFKTLGVFVAILILNFTVKLIRSQRKTEEIHKAPFTERAGVWINRFPKIFTLGGLILLGSAAVLSLVAVLLLLNGRNPIQAYGTFLRDTYNLLIHGLLIGYQLVSTGWLILSALAGSVNVSLANLLVYAAAIILAMIAWRRALVNARVRVPTTRNGH